MMKKWYSSVLCLAGLLAVAPSLHGQGAVYTASRTARIQAGVGYLYMLPDYVNTKIQGASIWGDYDFRRWVGVEGMVHIGSIITPSDIAENSYEVGPRFMYHKRKATVYGKILFGRATITNQTYNLSSSYNMYSFGGGMEYQIKPKFNIRVVDFEEQKWPNFEPNTLSPVAITIGVSYIIK